MTNSFQWFESQLWVIDFHCEVNHHPSIPAAILIRPSHPRFRDALIARAEELRPIGVALIVIKEIEEHLYPYRSPKLSLFQKFKKLWLK